MTIRARRAAKTNRAALALAGLGAPDTDERHFVTSLTRTPPNNADHLVTPPRPDKERLQRNVHACSEPFECDPFAADMLARALSVADGNAFFRAYDPAAYLPAKTDRKSAGDLAVQYVPEARETLKALDGLNIPPDLLVTAAFVGMAAGRLEPGSHAPTRQAALDALAALCVRLLANQKTAEDASSAFDGFLAAFRKQLERTGLATSA
jgi:hypothetical protein